MKVVVGAFNQEKALVGAFSVIVKIEVEVEVGTSGVPSVGAGWARPGGGGRQQY